MRTDLWLQSDSKMKNEIKHCLCQLLDFSEHQDSVALNTFIDLQTNALTEVRRFDWDEIQFFSF